MTGHTDTTQIYFIRDKTLFGTVGSSHLISRSAGRTFKVFKNLNSNHCL